MSETMLIRRWAPQAAVVCAVAGIASGCGDSSGSGGSGATGTASGQTSTLSGPTTTTTTTGSGGGGPLTLSPVADAPVAFDATPDPAGTTIFFTAVDATKGPGVFQVPANGSNLTPSEVTAGAPFVAPFGIATSTDGATLYVADPGADSGATYNNGVIYSLSSAGGTPTVVSGTANYQPRGLEVFSDNGTDILYFTGRDPATGAPGIFKIAAAGGAAAPLATGAPFVDPSGVAIAADGSFYVADTIAAGSHTAQFFHVTDGTAAPQPVNFPNTALPVIVGFPAGIALSLDGKTIYVSGNSPVDHSDSLITITGNSTTVISNPGFLEAAGLHRAKAANVLAWADSAGGPSGGRVSVIK